MKALAFQACYREGRQEPGHNPAHLAEPGNLTSEQKQRKEMILRLAGFTEDEREQLFAMLDGEPQQVDIDLRYVRRYSIERIASLGIRGGEQRFAEVPIAHLLPVNLGRSMLATVPETEPGRTSEAYHFDLSTESDVEVFYEFERFDLRGLVRFLRTQESMVGAAKPDKNLVPAGMLIYLGRNRQKGFTDTHRDDPPVFSVLELLGPSTLSDKRPGPSRNKPEDEELEPVLPGHIGFYLGQKYGPSEGGDAHYGSGSYHAADASIPPEHATLILNWQIAGEGNYGNIIDAIEAAIDDIEAYWAEREAIFADLPPGEVERVRDLMYGQDQDGKGRVEHITEARHIIEVHQRAAKRNETHNHYQEKDGSDFVWTRERSWRIWQVHNDHNLEPGQTETDRERRARLARKTRRLDGSW